MRHLILIICGIGVATGLAFYLGPVKSPPGSPPQPAAESGAIQGQSDVQSAEPVTVGVEQPGRAAPASSDPPAASTPVSSAGLSAAGTTADSTLLAQAVETLVSPQATHAQRQKVWKQLREAGRLDGAIAELERRLPTELRSAEYPAALGEAYLQKCGVIQDAREQGLLALQADKLFDNALSLDPANWEARFTKAVAMTHWPASMNKSEEVIQNFQTLIEQQETQPPQPHFAEPYAWLGDQYQKAGQNDAAHSIWARGAALFPNDAKLNQRLAPAQ